MQNSAISIVIQHIAKIIGILLLCLALPACGKTFRGMDDISSCVESKEKEAASPHGVYVATLYQRNCGATTDFVTHINLRRASDATRTEAGGIISKDQVLLASGRPAIQLQWLDDISLVLTIDEKDRRSIVNAQDNWNSIRIKIAE